MSNAASRSWTLRVNVVAASPLVTVERRLHMLRKAGMTIGQGVCVLPNSWIFSSDLTIGDDALLGYHCHIENTAEVTIGAGCSLAQRVTIGTTTHEIGAAQRRAGPIVNAPVEIGVGCWIGAGAVILPGVKVGPGCVIAAGSVVTRDCEPDGLYAGTPATRKRAVG